MGRIKTLEKSLEDEKRRLASMELQLRDARKQRDAEQQLVGVHKQSKMLESMFGALTKVTRKEVDDRQQWEEGVGSTPHWLRKSLTECIE